MTATPCGAWPSPLSAAAVAAGGVGLEWPRLVGDEDRVVPPSQAELFRDALARKHIPHA